jgi:hypothetical protein
VVLARWYRSRMRRTLAAVVGLAALWLLGAVSVVSAEAAGDVGFGGAQRHLPARTLVVPFVLDDDTVRLVAALDEMGFVAFGGIGYEVVVSEGELVTRELAARPRAAVALAWLVVHGRPAARLYAYWALRRVDPVAARGHRQRLGNDATSVLTVSGCVGRMATVAAGVGLAERRALRAGATGGRRGPWPVAARARP